MHQMLRTNFVARLPTLVSAAFFALSVALTLLATAQNAAAQPNINDSFNATITANVDETTLMQLFSGYNSAFNSNFVTTNATVYSSYSQNLLGFEFQSTGDNFLVTTSPGVPGVFDFISQSELNGTCSDNGLTGSLWSDTQANGEINGIDLCANGNRPIELIYNLGDLGQVDVFFSIFIHGTPDSSDFVGLTPISIPEPSSVSLVAIALAASVVALRKRRNGI